MEKLCAVEVSQRCFGGVKMVVKKIDVQADKIINILRGVWMSDYHYRVHELWRL